MEIYDVKESPDITIYEFSGENLEILTCINNSLLKMGEEKVTVSLKKDGEKNTLKAYKEISKSEPMLLYKFPTPLEESGEILCEVEQKFMIKLRSYHCQCHNKITQD
ncbi:MAG: hypothetical protein WCO35_00085 [Candidatus Nomurabacteria bacterium]